MKINDEYTTASQTRVPMPLHLIFIFIYLFSSRNGTLYFIFIGERVIESRRSQGASFSFACKCISITANAGNSVHTVTAGVFCVELLLALVDFSMHFTVCMGSMGMAY